MAAHEPRTTQMRNANSNFSFSFSLFSEPIYFVRPQKILITNTIEMKLSAVSLALRSHLLCRFNHLKDGQRFFFHSFFSVRHSFTIDSNERASLCVAIQLRRTKWKLLRLSAMVDVAAVWLAPVSFMMARCMQVLCRILLLLFVFCALNLKRLNKSFMRWHCFALRKTMGSAYTSAECVAYTQYSVPNCSRCVLCAPPNGCRRLDMRAHCVSCNDRVQQKRIQTNAGWKWSDHRRDRNSKKVCRTLWRDVAFTMGARTTISVSIHTHTHTPINANSIGLSHCVQSLLLFSAIVSKLKRSSVIVGFEVGSKDNWTGSKECRAVNGNRITEHKNRIDDVNVHQHHVKTNATTKCTDCADHWQTIARHGLCSVALEDQNQIGKFSDPTKRYYFIN